jgi:hypothetical protein
MHRLLFCLLPLALISSCANVSSDFKFDPTKPNGLVIGSISYESGLARFFLVATSTTTPNTVEFAFGCALVPCLQPSDDSHFSKGEMPAQRGGGFAVEIPEGSYRISSWRAARGYIISRSASPIGIEFTVARGKASYIGNLHFDADWENVTLRDKSRRDLPLLREQYPVLQSVELAFTIAPDAAVPRLGGIYQTGIELPRTPIFVPVIKR